ncbi:hypothetical protein [Paraburkholderia sp. JPY419]|uniref:hypothetical protein n=1 Tax=Paraburkholderia sp. JPY419 TaxID=667660 RepID=UPI003D25E802
MSETWMGLVIGGTALGIAMFMVVSHYRRERMRARMLRELNRHDSWHQTRTKVIARRTWISTSAYVLPERSRLT